MQKIGYCSRCGRRSLEYLPTHSFCLECSYSPDSDSELSQYFLTEYRKRRSGRSRAKRSEQSECDSILSSQLGGLA